VAAAINRPVSGTILLVEDQDEVRKFATTVLRHRGFHVISAADGKKALSLAEDHPGLIDLIVTDVIMPGMNGHELARRIGQMRPGIRVLYTSGYGSEVIATRGVLEHDADYLPKPYDSRVLCAKVCEVLVANQKSVS
jgi:DNA-binding response OmpR family regulator